jgi:plasmid stabilization system protein ParE
MYFNLLFSPEAQNDLQEIYDWYETALPGLGERFIDELEKKIFKLANTPGIGAIRYEDVRCTLIPDLPYLIHYGVNLVQKQIIAYRIFHTSRKPLWDKD